MASIKINLNDIHLSKSELLQLVRAQLILPDSGMQIIEGEYYKDEVIDRDRNTEPRPTGIKATEQAIKHYEAYNQLFEVFYE